MADSWINSSSPPNNQDTPRSKKVLHGFLMGVLLIMLLGGLGWWLYIHQVDTAAAAGPHAGGLAIPAQLLAQNGHAWIDPASPVQYISEDFVEVQTDDTTRYASRMAPGLSWISAPVYMFGGPRAALYVNPALTLLTVLFLFLLCRRWMGGWFALLAALTYAAYPAASLTALEIDPHTSATAFLALGLFFLDGWARRPGPWKALAAGLSFGLVPTILPGAAVCGIGVALLVLAKVWDEGPRWRQLLLLVLGAAVPLGIFAIHNQMVLGTWLPADSIYSVEQDAGPGVGLFAGLGLAGMVAMLWQRDAHLLGIGLLGIVLAVAAPHIRQDITGGALATTLPTFPLLVLGAYWVLRQLAVASPRVGWPAALAVTALALGMWVPLVVQETPAATRGRLLAATVVEAANKHLAKDSLVVCGPRLADPLAYAGWQIADASLITATGATGLPVEAAADKKPRSYREAYHKLSGDERTQKVVEDVFRWADGRKVYWVGRAQDDFHAKGQLIQVIQIEMPAAREGDGLDDTAPAWQIPDDGQPILVYEWLPEQPAPATRPDTRKDK